MSRWIKYLFCISGTKDSLLRFWSGGNSLLSSTSVPALLPCAVLPRQARGTHRKRLHKPTVQFILSLSIGIKYLYLLDLYLVYAVAPDDGDWLAEGEKVGVDAVREADVVGSQSPTHQLLVHQLLWIKEMLHCLSNILVLFLVTFKHILLNVHVDSSSR